LNANNKKYIVDSKPNTTTFLALVKLFICCRSRFVFNDGFGSCFVQLSTSERINLVHNFIADVEQL
jgi:hypothetical protein